MSNARIVALLALVALCLPACSPGVESDGGSAAPPPTTGSAPAQTNLVVVTLDTTRADALGAYGQARPTSPRIDAMAAEGVLFEQAVSSSPSTLPSHSTLFTGKQPYVHGVRSNAGYQLSDVNQTLAELLRQRGYRTRAEVAAPVLGAATRLDQGFDEYRDPASEGSVLQHLEELQGPELGRALRHAEEITAAGIEFLRSQADRPFFLWLHYFDPHVPHDPGEPFQSILREPYFAEIRRVDYQVGRILDELDELGLRDRTLVVLTADHGEGRGEHGERTHSFFVYDATIRVPLVFRGPGVPLGRRVASLVRTVDVMPTLLDLLGLPAAADAQGVSLRPLFEEPSADLGLTGYGETIEQSVAFGSSPLRYVRVGPWKYVHKLEPELFDVVADPGELTNLAESHPDTLKRLRARLRELLVEAPSKPTDATVTVDDEEMQRLRMLGYVAGPALSSLDDELATLELRGPDPTDRIADVDGFANAWGMLLSGEYEGARQAFSILAERNPESLFIPYGYARSLLELDRHAEAIELLRRVLEMVPDAMGERLTLARALDEIGDAAGAERVLLETLQLDPCAAGTRVKASEMLRRRGRYAEQIELLEAEEEACEGSVMVRNALAFALAITPEPELRDGERALRLSQAVVAETEGAHPDYIDTLAAAYAELGDFERAVAEQKRALALVEGRAVPEGVVAGLQRHLAVYESGRPLREP